MSIPQNDDAATEVVPSSNVQSKRRTVLLVGRTGNGKSSVGNSILGLHDCPPTFKPREPSEETMLKNEIAYNDKFVVVDSSGIGDTESDMPGNMPSVINSAIDALISNRNIQNGSKTDKSVKKPPVLQRCGFDALIFVFKYGVRFTKQEKDAVQMVKSIFGEHVFKFWGILVFSYGDNFKLDTVDKKIFEDWCREQTGDIKTLFDEVQFRCVVFDNKTKDRAVIDQQSTNLFKEIKKLDQIEGKGSLNQYILEDFISVREKHFNQMFTRLNKEKELLILTLKNDERRLKKVAEDLQKKLEEEWRDLEEEVGEQIKYLSLEEKSTKIGQNVGKSPAQVGPNDTVSPTQVGSNAGASKTQEPIKSKQNTLSEFLDSHQCPFNVNHKLIVKDYIAHLIERKTDIENVIENMPSQQINCIIS